MNKSTRMNTQGPPIPDFLFFIILLKINMWVYRSTLMILIGHIILQRIYSIPKRYWQVSGLLSFKTQKNLFCLHQSHVQDSTTLTTLLKNLNTSYLPVSPPSSEQLSPLTYTWRPLGVASSSPRDDICEQDLRHQHLRTVLKDLLCSHFRHK